jgi:hypothetical protein
MLTFRPDRPPNNIDSGLSNWLSRQFENIRKAANAAAEYLYLATSNNSPSRQKDGEVRLADGDNWDPGFGYGPYVWSDAADRWVPVLVVDVGGTVTQTTSKSEPVTLNARSGEITMDNAALAATTAVTFTMTNSYSKAGCLFVVNRLTANFISNYDIGGICSNGSVAITVYNRTAGSRSDKVKFRFLILPGVTS